MTNARNLSKLVPSEDGRIEANDLSGGQSGAAPIFGARAWVNFVGSSGSINASGNVSGVTRTGTGAYTITFSIEMPTSSYAIVCLGGNTNGSTGYFRVTGASQSTTSCSITVSNSATTANDPPSVSVVIFC
jgi:hypothetical protein